MYDDEKPERNEEIDFELLDGGDCGERGERGEESVHDFDRRFLPERLLQDCSGITPRLKNY